MCTERKATGLFVLADFLCENEVEGITIPTEMLAAKAPQANTLI